MKRFVAAAFAATAFATPAFAQTDANAFTGFRVEGLIGYDAVSVPGLKNPDGILYGIGAGYDFNAGGVILGIEADITDSTAKVKLAGPDVVTDRDIYVGARAGAVLGSALLYAKAGYTNARLEQGAIHENGDGVRLGVGAEYVLGGNMFLKTEYRYSNYEGDVSRHQVVGGFGLRF